MGIMIIIKNDCYEDDDVDDNYDCDYDDVDNDDDADDDADADDYDGDDDDNHDADGIKKTINYELTICNHTFVFITWLTSS